MWVQDRQDAKRRIRINTRFLRRVGAGTLTAVGPKGAACTLMLVSDSRMAALNRAFCGVEQPTDVLAFPAGDAPPGLPPPDGTYLGDLAISVETARRQAARRGHPLEREAALLLIHGILHLVGYDHRTPAGRRLMWRRQAGLLRAQCGPPRAAARRAPRRP